MKDKGKYLKYGLHIAVVVGLVWAVVKYVNVQEVIEALRTFNRIYIPIMIALALASFLLKALRFIIMIGPFTENLSNWIIAKGYMAGQAIALLPGGVTARAGLMKQVGVPIEDSGAPVLFQSSWDQAVLLLGGLIAALWFPAARLPIFIITGILLLLAALLIIPASRSWLAGLAERIAARFNFEEQWQRFLKSLPKVFTRKIIAWCFVLTVAAFACQFAILLLAVNGLEMDIPIPTLFLAFVVPTVLGRLVPVPGGFGVTEAGMVGFLTSTTDVNSNNALTAVALFRIAAILIPVAVGAIIYFFAWNGQKEVDEETADAGQDTGEKQKNVQSATLRP